MSAGRYVWKLPATVRAFMASDAFCRMMVGPVGSGKSSGCVAELLRRAGQQAPGPDGIRRTRAAVVRNTYPELRDTTRKTVEQWLDETRWSKVATWREAENKLTIEHADLHFEVLFRALDDQADVRKLLSLELTFAWLNEAREIPRAVFDMIQTRVGRYPSKLQGGPTWFGVWGDTNPPDLDHWIPRIFEEERPKGFAIFHQPSGLSPEAENIDYLPPGYYERLVAGKDQGWVDVYAHGKYGFVRDGKPVFPEWNDAIHATELVPDPEADIILGMDFGLTPAAVLAQRDRVDGQLQVFDELVSESMGATTFARELATKLKRDYPHRPVRGWGDPAGEQRSQVDERTPFDVVQAAGLPVAPAPTNDVRLRRDAVGGLLTRLTIRGRPALVVDPKCRTLRKAMSGAYCYRRLQVSGDDRFRDVPDKNAYSHVADALQYVAVGEGEDSRAVYGSEAQRRVAVPFQVRRSSGEVAWVR